MKEDEKDRSPLSILLVGTLIGSIIGCLLVIGGVILFIVTQVSG